MEQKEKNILMISGGVLVVVLVLWLTFSGGASNNIDENNDNSADSTTETSSNNSVPVRENQQVVEVKNKPVTTSTAGESPASNRGNNLCVFETNENDIFTVTTSYISGPKSRVDVVKREGGQGGALISQNHTVSDGVWIYTWSLGATVGKKERVSGSGLAVPQSSGGAVLVSESSYASWDCRPWIPDQSKLTPPSFVSFN